jgi:hypothetical protein
MVFTDYKKAFHGMKREEIWKSLDKIGNALNILIKVKNTYKGTIKCIKTNKGWSTWFETISGVRQGSILSPTLLKLQ